MSYTERQRAVDIARYWPPVIGKMRDFEQIATAENPEFEDIWGTFERFINDCFVQTATEYAIERWEYIYQITTRDGTLDERRGRILAAMARQIPYTMRSLRRMLTNLLGEGNFTVNVNPITLELSVLIDISRKSQMLDVQMLLESVVPANLSVTLTHRYATHEMISIYSHGELSAYTHNQIKEQLVIK